MSGEAAEERGADEHGPARTNTDAPMGPLEKLLRGLTWPPYSCSVDLLAAASREYLEMKEPLRRVKPVERSSEIAEEERLAKHGAPRYLIGRCGQCLAVCEAMPDPEPITEENFRRSRKWMGRGLRLQHVFGAVGVARCEHYLGEFAAQVIKEANPAPEPGSGPDWLYLRSIKRWKVGIGPRCFEVMPANDLRPRDFFRSFSEIVAANGRIEATHVFKVSSRRDFPEVAVETDSGEILPGYSLVVKDGAWWPKEVE